MQVKSIAECSKGSILQYFRLSLSYHLSLKSFFVYFEWPLKKGFAVLAASSYTHMRFCVHVGTPLQLMFCFCFVSLSSTGSILSNTDLSDLSTVGSCDIFVYQMRHRVIWFARLAGSILFIKRVITCHWNGFWKCHAENVFKNVWVHTIWSVYGWIP